jgi:signal transduction histidine kinase
MSRFFPNRLAGQFILLLLSTLILAQLFSVILFLSDSDYIYERLERNMLIKRAAQAVNMLDDIPLHYHKQVLNVMTVHRVKFTLDDSTDIPKDLQNQMHQGKITAITAMLDKPHLQVLIHEYQIPAYRIIGTFKYLSSHLLALFTGQEPPQKRNKLLTVSVLLDNQRWLNMNVLDRDPFPLWAQSSLFSLLMMSLLLVVIVVVTVKKITQPLSELAAKARQLGLGEPVKPIAEQGPLDIKDAVSAFNTMQQRLNNIIVHRARSLAAMSHDLRTPLTSLRLHAEFISDEETQQKMVEKIDEMEQIAKATISFAKQDSWSEVKRRVDLGSLVESLCLDLQDLGLKVDYGIFDRINYTCRPVALKRAFSNLIENGVKYGQQVYVSISEEKHDIKVIIADQGQGIPETEHQRIFQAFERLEDSRNKDSGGIGLGMTIALTIIQDHGGEINLHNRPCKGLDVVVTLPKQ